MGWRHCRPGTRCYHSAWCDVCRMPTAEASQPRSHWCRQDPHAHWMGEEGVCSRERNDHHLALLAADLRLHAAGTHHLHRQSDQPWFLFAGASASPWAAAVCGNRGTAKCVHDLVRAVGYLRQQARTDPELRSAWKSELQLRIVGPLLHPPTEQLLRKTISELELGQQVKILGAVSETELMIEYAQAQVLLLSSREETAPQVIAQAMACGLPIVASAVGGVPAMIRDGENGLLFPFGNAEKCGDQVLRLLEDKSLYGRFSEGIRAEAQTRFHPDSVAQQTVDVYRHALSQRAT